MKKKVILSLLPDLRGGGAERVCLDLAYEFDRQGYQVEFLVMSARGELLAEAQASFSIYDLGCSRARKLTLVIARYLRSYQPDVVIANMWPLTVVVPFSARLAGYRGRTLVVEHGILSAQYATWGRAHRVALQGTTAFGYRLANARIGVSRGVANDMAKLSGMSANRFSVANNPVRSLQQPTVRQMSDAENLWGKGGQRILSVGSLKQVKNHSLLLRAFAKIVSKQEARLMLLGQGENEAMLRSLASELGIADMVIFAGFLADPSPFYHTADLFALSSNYEGFGNVIVEAMACGTPVVSTDCPSGPAEILEHGRWGRLTPVGDSEALAEAMVDALNTTWDAEQLRKRAAHFAPSVAARKYLDLLDPS